MALENRRLCMYGDHVYMTQNFYYILFCVSVSAREFRCLQSSEVSVVALQLELQAV